MDHDTPSELLTMLLADARLPVAGHTQSGGLEPALRDGLTDVPGYLRTRLSTVVRVEAGSAVVTLHHLRQGCVLQPVEAAWAARTPSPAMRRTSRIQARALLRLAGRLWPDDPSVRSVTERTLPPRAIALGAVASAGRLSPRSLARLVGYDDVQTVAAAALKLMPLDPAEVTLWVRDALDDVEAMADAVAGLTTPHEIPATGAPIIDAWAEAHARSTRRLFSA